MKSKESPEPQRFTVLVINSYIQHRVCDVGRYITDNAISSASLGRRSEKIHDGCIQVKAIYFDKQMQICIGKLSQQIVGMSKMYTRYSR